MYLFTYGSLMNPASLKKTLPVRKRLIRNAVLRGYKRKLNALVDGCLYLNIVPDEKAKIEGKLIQVSFAELKKIKLREIGYSCREVTSKIENSSAAPVFTFVAPDVSYPRLKIPRSYLITCLAGVVASKRKKWLTDTLIQNEIMEDLEKPVYRNATVKR